MIYVVSVEIVIYAIAFIILAILILAFKYNFVKLFRPDSFPKNRGILEIIHKHRLIFGFGLLVGSLAILALLVCMFFGVVDLMPLFIALLVVVWGVFSIIFADNLREFTDEFNIYRIKFPKPYFILIGVMCILFGLFTFFAFSFRIRF